jgi:hypothetical protein
MKIKKSELLALIKEEIMVEMRGLTMMDDPYDDDAVPAGMEQGGAMDQVAKEIDHMIIIQMDDVISMLSNYLVTSGASRDPRRAAAMGMEMLHDAGLAFPDQRALERMIAPDDDDEDMPMMQEGMENITPENIGIVFEALGKMAPMIAAMGVPAFIVMLKEFYDERKGGRDGGEM